MRLIALLLGAVLALPAAAQVPAKRLFGAHPQPSAGPLAVHGGYARGCIAGAVELPETGPSWQAMRLSRNRNWGHPDLIAFIARLGAAAQAAGWAGIHVGDMAQPRGGPMITGHRSHQIGLDADIWLRPAERLNRDRAAREKIGSPRLVTDSRLSVTAGWTPAHHRVLKAAASDPAVARIFVNAAIKKALCEAEPADADRDWLRRIRPWWGHDAHFHVRLHCPEGQPGCEPQAPIEAGDGCGADLAWWFTDEALNPKPSDKPRVELTLADLPPACAELVR